MKLLGITQSQLANALCIVLTSSGIGLQIASVFPTPWIDLIEARNLGKDFLSTGITLGFGVGISKLGQKKPEGFNPIPKGH